MTFGPVSGMLPWEVPWDVVASFQEMFVWMQGLDDFGVPEEYMADLPASAYWLAPHALVRCPGHCPYAPFLGLYPPPNLLVHDLAEDTARGMA